ncbi:MAG: dihydroorotate dehydrogenase-like protein [Gammaproteobacteria bacterium]|mgnify:FL=1|jgi:dihydroorotate dehydrogenase (fumarate)|nr:dihydroorotate dehydrogenase-like protein [Gammaproteobacteria bacterium]MBT3724882.1 dihydroorotate dehydrogenase-like protein [Gammaproteobacteria bacterium]MBT4075795.1 dihydroorotate dehydrogenase-like protein [Gammaproteobacteria bacterium]MBT4192957.1 dihydroorotate dehydrogenase-like protein [Gammaproteobacteria bacterium]MBT4450891.1 dihydroorotate dehydrogenase-like protein [Gammaproteobacteria bacterium]
MDLSTQYMGLDLKNPIVASSSPLTWALESSLALQKAGAAAIIMPSLFEEQIEHEQAQLDRFIHQQSIGHSETNGFHPQLTDYMDYQNKYLNQLELLKRELSIPVIASLNGISEGGWVQNAQDLEQAGADALELNIYYVAANPEESSAQVEQRYLSVFEAVKQCVKIPVGVKLTHQFSAISSMVKQLEQAGAAGISLFNRFYQPDIDLETLHIEPKLELSSSSEALLRIRWIAILRHQLSLSLAITGGMHSSEDVLKGLLAGADITCMCSVLLEKGPEHIGRVLEQMSLWMMDKEYESVNQLKGSLSYINAVNPAAFERANYVEILNSYSPASGVQV